MSLTLATPTSFPAFPFHPYDIQLSLMRHLYENIENRRVTVVESPTGTVSTYDDAARKNALLTIISFHPVG